jgi:adenine phosphoribosyltransferase
VQLGIGFGMVRKRGKLPGSVVSHAYSLEYGMDSIEISADLIEAGSRVVVIDDLIATGGTAAATVELLRKIGAEPVAAVFLIELTFLNGRAKLDVPVEAPAAIQQLSRASDPDLTDGARPTPSACRTYGAAGRNSRPPLRTAGSGIVN